MNKNELPDYYLNGFIAGKYDIDGDRQVIRIILEDTFFYPRTSFQQAISECLSVDGFTVWQDVYWNCGTRFDLDETLSLQLCFDGGNGRWTYWQQVILPKIETIVGSLIFVAPNLTYTFRTIRSIVADYMRSIDGELTYVRPLPFIIVAASEQENLENWNENYLRKELDLADEIPIVSYVIGDKESARYVLMSLLEQVLKGFNETDEQQETIF